MPHWLNSVTWSFSYLVIIMVPHRLDSGIVLSNVLYVAIAAGIMLHNGSSVARDLGIVLMWP